MCLYCRLYEEFCAEKLKKGLISSNLGGYYLRMVAPLYALPLGPTAAPWQILRP